MSDYNLILLVKSDGKEKETLELVKKSLGSQSTIAEIAEWGVKELAYPIKKQTSAAYYSLALSLPSDKIQIIDQTMRVNDNVLRHLLLKKEGKKVEVVEKPKKTVKKVMKK
ncbi:30S ribosomal protein S6 [Candidatus Microgenomates bacterium]|nr:30S ribosomal protein S6 [Candidatus Microgenomates bacterium]